MTESEWNATLRTPDGTIIPEGASEPYQNGAQRSTPRQPTEIDGRKLNPSPARPSVETDHALRDRVVQSVRDGATTAAAGAYLAAREVDGTIAVYRQQTTLEPEEGYDPDG